MHAPPVKPPTVRAQVADSVPAVAATPPPAPASDPTPSAAPQAVWEGGPAGEGAGGESAADAAEAADGLAKGVLAVRHALKAAPAGSGVYRMIAEDGGVLYVGKAKALNKRLVAYARPAAQSIRIRRMIARTRHVELVTTQTEAEALLLEANLIKRYKPRYNILLRDDKSFPSIVIPSDHAYPQVLKHRGARARPGAYFGPFASGYAVNETLTILQRAFLLRTCSDSVFESRTRPCLLFQIKRCSGPCAGRIAEDAYGALVDQARAYLKGESRAIQDRIVAEMEEASAALEFERAAMLRDRIRALAAVQARQSVNVEGVGDADVVASHAAGGQTCVQVFFIRGGRNYGNRAYFPSHAADEPPGAVMEAFLGQFYQGAMPASEVLVSERLPGHAVLAEALGVRAGRKVEVRVPQRGARRELIEHARVNAREALQRRMAENATQRRLLEGLAQTLGLDAPPERIEV
jgi:excinuclease ABC subunit C